MPANHWAYDDIMACAVIVRMMNLINGSTPAAPITPVTPTQPEQPQQPTQPQQPEPPEQTTTGKLANGKDATTENVLKILEEIKKEYPDGTIWGDRDTPGTNYYSAGRNSVDVNAALNNYRNTAGSLGLNTVYACGGWAAMVSDRIFGQSGAPAREVTAPSKVRAGDFLICLNRDGKLTHVSIAISNASYNGTFWGFMTCGGNANGGYVS